MTRLELARAEIARRRALAQAATPGPWHIAKSGSIDAGLYDTVLIGGQVECGSYCQGGTSTLEWGQEGDVTFVAANDPAHVLAVLAAADVTLDRHARTHTCQARWLTDEQAAEHNAPTTGQYVWPHLLCADAKAVLDLYAPEVAP